MKTHQAVHAATKMLAPPSRAVAETCSLRASGWSRYPDAHATRIAIGVRANARISAMGKASMKGRTALSGYPPNCSLSG
jgi:hypothetical protein